MPDHFESEVARARRLIRGGKLAAARALCKHMLQKGSPSPASVQLLVEIEVAAGRPSRAAEELRRLLGARPDCAALHLGLADLLRRLNRAGEAAPHYEAALAGGPADPGTLLDFAAAQETAGRPDEALALLERVCAEHPQNAAGWRRLGRFHFGRGDRGAALRAFQRAAAVAPDHAETHANLGVLFRSQARHLDALAAFEKAVALEPGNRDFRLNAASARKRLGDDRQAFAHFEQLGAWVEEDPARHSLYLFDLLQSDRDRLSVYQAHLRYGDLLSKRAQVGSHGNERNEHRRLRVGYVSADFKQHVVAQFIGPIFEHHDRAAVELYAYSQVRFPDAVTRRFEATVDCWRPIWRLNDMEAAAQILSDEIDVLVDLSGHTAGNRLGVFAHKPAPIQVSWLGYPGTTGLPQMDYRLSDPHLASEHTQEVVRERLFRLPRVAASYARPPDLPIVPPPSRANGHLTFGSTNSVAKITDATVATWAQVLTAVPRSKLFLKAHCLGHPELQGRMRARFAAAGLDPERLEFEDFSPQNEYLRTYGKIDILLDPFPYTGGSTTRGALWMGVPVITLEGIALYERVTSAMLRSVGLDECVAHSRGDYLGKAVALAQSPLRLAEIRSSLRGRLLETCLFDSRAVAHDLQAAYREMWRTWLMETAGKPASADESPAGYPAHKRRNRGRSRSPLSAI